MLFKSLSKIIKNNKKIVLILFAVTYILAVFISFTKAREIALIIGFPALLLSGWAFFGHLVTIDDDFPSGWSNPKGSIHILFVSLSELLIKFLVFAVLIVLVYLRNCNE
jgi:hypothetical protein